MFGRKKKVTGKITLGEILRGTRPGRIQSVGYMQVIPLVSDIVDERFVPPEEALVGTTSYGTMEFENESDLVLIVPLHAGYVVKRAAQDHAMSHVGLVPAKETRTYDTAMCIQQTQGGLISKSAHRLTILPFALRESALEKRDKKSYSKLWEDIARFNRDLGLADMGHLEYFLKQFRRELDQFVAEFECVPGQVGAIILVADTVVGIERAPNHAYWRGVWPALIRECYGSLAIQIARRRPESAPPESRMPLPEEIGTLVELSAALEDVCREEDERTKGIVRGLLDEQLEVRKEEKTSGLAVETLGSRRFSGQVVRDDERVVYASLVLKEKYRKKAQWDDAKPFEI